MTRVVARERIWDALARVMDPEIPVVSVVDMGMVKDVTADARSATITMLPTFTGCPAIDVIRQDVGAAIASLDEIDHVVVEFSYDPPWTPDRITDDGRAKLKDFGIAPPTGTGPVLITEIGLPTAATCPFCGSCNTRAENPFGPTPCRAIYYCAECRNPFEQFKDV